MKPFLKQLAFNLLVVLALIVFAFLRAINNILKRS